MPKTFAMHALTTVGLLVAALPVAAVASVTLAPSASAATECTGTIAVTRDDTGSVVGSIARDLASGRFHVTTTAPSAAGRFRVTKASGSDTDLREIAPVGSYPADRSWLGMSLAYAATIDDPDLRPGRENMLFATYGSRTAPGAGPAEVANAFDDRPYESAIWTVAPDGAVGVRWIRPDTTPFDLTTAVYANAPVATADLAASRERYGVLAATFTLVPDVGAAAACGITTPQVIAFGEGTPTTGFVGRTATITATGGGSGNPVTFSSDTPEVCTVDAAGEVTYLAAGTCTIAADQDGTEPDGEDPGYRDAETATTSITVALEPSTTVLSATEDPVVGQDVEVTADVTSDAAATDATPAGTVQFSVDDVEVGDPVAVDADGEATYDAGPLAKGAHDLDAVFTPTDADVVAGSSDHAVVTVAAADTTTTLTVERRQVSATVAVDEPGAGTPTGDVVFSVDGETIGTASLSNGVAVLPGKIAAGDERSVAATYQGTEDYTASSDSTTRTDPVVTIEVGSTGELVNGWWNGPVTVTFTCQDDDAALTKPCPAPVTRSRNGAEREVTRTIRALDGGTTTISVGLSIDQRGPLLAFQGVEPRTVYPNGVPGRARCTAVDDLSGVDDSGCTLRKRRVEDTNRVILTAAATDVAGNRSTKSIVVFVPRRGADPTRP